MLKPKHKESFFGRMRRESWLELYLFLLPAMAVTFVFKYIPMNGIVIAFQDYNIFKGIGGSPFVGMKHFSAVFSNPDFFRVLKNTLVINLYKIVFLGAAAAGDGIDD